MSPHIYSQMLEVVKTAAKRRKRDEEDAPAAKRRKRDEEDAPASNTRRNLAMAAAGALPFAGLIGQPSAQHYHQGADFGERYKNWRKTLKPGDVILSGSREMSDFDSKMVALGTGHPEGYHVAVYAGNGKVLESSPPDGTMLSPIEEYRPTKEDAKFVQVLRPKRTRPELRAYIADLRKRHNQTGQLERALHQRFKSLASKGRRGSNDALEANLGKLSQKELKELAGHYRQVVYDEIGAIKGVFKDALVPKIVSDQSVAQEAAQRAAGRRNPSKAIKTTTDNLMAELRNQAAKGKDLKKVDPVFLRHGAAPCLEGVCSSFAGESLGGKRPVVKGKHLREILPQDFLRSDQVTPVSRLTPKTTATQRLRNSVLRQGPNIIRGITGLGLAGGVYGLSALADRLNNSAKVDDPQLA